MMSTFVERSCFFDKDGFLVNLDMAIFGCCLAPFYGLFLAVLKLYFCRFFVLNFSISRLIF